MIDPCYTDSIKPRAVRVEVENGEESHAITLHNPTLGHIKALLRIGCAILPESDLGDGWDLDKTITALAVLMVPGGLPQEIFAAIEAPNSDGTSPLTEADAFLSHAFGPWQSSEESWGNEGVDAFLHGVQQWLVGEIALPEVERKTGKSNRVKNAWPELLVARCCQGTTREDAHRMTPTEAFYFSEALSEASGRGSILIDYETRLIAAKKRRERIEQIIKNHDR